MATRVLSNIDNNGNTTLGFYQNGNLKASLKTDFSITHRNSIWIDVDMKAFFYTCFDFGLTMRDVQLQLTRQFSKTSPDGWADVNIITN